MFVSKYATIQITLFGIVGTGLLVSAEISDPATFSSLDSFSRRELSPLKHSSKPPKKLTTPSFLHPRTKKLTDPTAAMTLRQQETQQMLRSIRAGGTVKRNEQTARGTISSSSSSLQQQSEKFKKFFLLLTSTVALYGLFHTRSTWMSLFNKEKLQASVVQSLEDLNSFPYLYSRSLYTIVMALWESLGMSTIPVETAAAMVFGWSAFFWSGIGKLLGACLAFGLGRGALSSVVEKKLSSNTFLKLVQTSTEENPLLVVILIKLSCFPETVKNFGSSMLKPIRWWMFVAGTAVHGGTFTALWTYLGVDTAARLKDTEGLLPPDQRLKILLTLALINGCVVSPLSMFYWMQTLKKKQKLTTTKKGSKRRI
jgi:uncharacterized membrane protein YdjX (TVP38/TMEM64 family)